MTLTFFVHGLPIAQPRQRHTQHGHNYTPRTHPVQAFKYTVAQEAREAAQREHWPLPCFAEAVMLAYTLYFPRPQALQWKRRPQTTLWHTHKPDLENVQKALADALTGIAWKDDVQIAQVHGRKFICGVGESVGVFCRIDALEEIV